MTDEEWQEQLKIAQATVNALMAQRNDEANRVANLIAQLDAAQRQIAAKDTQIKALMDAAKPAEPPKEKPNGITSLPPELRQELAPPPD